VSGRSRLAETLEKAMFVACQLIAEVGAKDLEGVE
jgi:hypothetical protein